VSGESLLFYDLPGIPAATTEEGFEQADEILTRIEHGVLG
jgi:hypothetical protein